MNNRQKLITPIGAVFFILTAIFTIMTFLKISTPIFAPQSTGTAIIGGLSSWYGSRDPEEGLNVFTSSGAKFDPTTLTAAMPDRKMLGKYFRVTSVRTGESIVVKINDVGPAKRLNRIIDLTRESFRILSENHLNWGIMKVKIRVINHNKT